MQKIKIQEKYYYSFVEGSIINKCERIPLFWYKDNNNKYILNFLHTGARESNTFNSLEDLELYVDDNYDTINNIDSLMGDIYKNYCDRFDNLVSEEEFKSMREIFSSKIGYDIFTFYNSALLECTGNVYFDVVKLDNYLQKEYHNEYIDGISLKEFVENKFGDEMSEILNYLVYCNKSNDLVYRNKNIK